MKIKIRLNGISSSNGLFLQARYGYRIMNKIIVLIFIALAVTSCTSTGKVWSKYKPAEYAYVVSDGIDPEPELKKADVKYYCKKVINSSSGLDKACYVEKSLAQKTNEFNEALMKTPAALAKDILVVGKVTLIALSTILGVGYHN